MGRLVPPAGHPVVGRPLASRPVGDRHAPGPPRGSAAARSAGTRGLRGARRATPRIRQPIARKWISARLPGVFCHLRAAPETGRRGRTILCACTSLGSRRPASVAPSRCEERAILVGVATATASRRPSAGRLHRNVPCGRPQTPIPAGARRRRSPASRLGRSAGDGRTDRRRSPIRLRGVPAGQGVGLHLQAPSGWPSPGLDR